MKADNKLAENTPTALVIGGGPAGLMAAERLGAAGLAVTIVDAKPSLGRKFLMAGKSGLNLTKDESFDDLMNAYGEAAPWLRPIIQAFDGMAVQEWARGLGQTLFTGSTGRVFPEAMKASPLLRAWLARLDEYDIVRQARWRWTGWDRDEAVFETPDGVAKMRPEVTVLALGGASWARLGSDGAWADILRADGIDLAAFAPANAGIFVNWSAHMRPVFGQPLKGVRFNAGPWASRGEAVLSERGLEGGGIYSVSHGVRDGADLEIDLFPDRPLPELIDRLSRPRGKTSLSNHLRKTLKLDGVRMALLNELARPLPQTPETLAQQLKALSVKGATLRPMDEAISTAGGVCHSALTEDLMLTARPGVFVAGEMLDWEAPTGGYLITACLATGRWAGEAAARWARQPSE